MVRRLQSVVEIGDAAKLWVRPSCLNAAGSGLGNVDVGHAVQKAADIADVVHLDHGERRNLMLHAQTEVMVAAHFLIEGAPADGWGRGAGQLRAEEKIGHRPYGRSLVVEGCLVEPERHQSAAAVLEHQGSDSSGASVIALVVAGRNPWRAVRPSRKCAPQCQASPKSCASPAISCGWSRRRDNRFARVHILDVIRADSRRVSRCNAGQATGKCRWPSDAVRHTRESCSSDVF